MSKDKITRRKFLKKSAIVGAVGTLSSVFGFSSFGGHAKVAKVAIRPTSNIIPGLLYDSPGADICGQYCDYMFRLKGPEQKREPSLVENYTSSADKKKWTFKVHEGVKFHHGTELTSKDVAYTFRRIMDPDVGSPAKTLFSNVKEIEEVDKYTVRFHLKKPGPSFPLEFFDYNTAVVAHDFDYSGEGKNKPTGTGAFKIKKYVPGEKLIMERNPDYFRPGLPKLDELHFTVVPEIETQVLMLISGDVDVVSFVNSQQFKRLKNNSHVSADMATGGMQAPISMRTDKPPFDDPRVRKAMKYCVDRQSMLDSALYGYGEIGHDHPVAPVYEWHKDLGTRERNIQKAKSLLKEAGYGNGLDITLYYTNNVDPAPAVALNLQRMARPAGINIKLQGSTSDVYYSKYWLKANLTCTPWAHRENVLDVLKLAYTSDGPWNEGHYKNPELDEHIEAASTTVDKEKRQKHFDAIQETLREDGPALIPVHQARYGGHNKRVKDVWRVRTSIADFRHMQIA